MSSGNGTWMQPGPEVGAEDTTQTDKATKQGRD